MAGLLLLIISKTQPTNQAWLFFNMNICDRFYTSRWWSLDISTMNSHCNMPRPLHSSPLQCCFKPRRVSYTNRYTLLGTSISPEKSILKMMFLFPRWDMLISWRVSNQPPYHFLLKLFLEIFEKVHQKIPIQRWNPSRWPYIWASSLIPPKRVT